jgi:uncharacterized membrane protein YfcA
VAAMGASVGGVRRAHRDFRKSGRRERQLGFRDVGTIGGAISFGSAVILAPVLSFAFGAAQTVPILTIAALIGNLSRVLFSWRETDWRAVAVYASGAVPGAILGSIIFVSISASWITRALGLFILLTIPASRFLARVGIKVKLWHLLPVGAAMGLLSGVVGTVGPINAPFFVAYGLVRSAYLATEAMGAVMVHLTKSLVYGRFAAIEPTSLTSGIAVGAGLLCGSYLVKKIVNRIDANTFRTLIESMLVVAGMLMLLG